MFFLCRRYSWDNIAQIKTLCIAQAISVLSGMLQITLHKKALCNVLLILLGQHCIQQCYQCYTTILCNNIIQQCCPRGSKQHCTGKKPGNVVWATSDHSVYIYIYNIYIIYIYIIYIHNIYIIYIYIIYVYNRIQWSWVQQAYFL